MSVTYLSCIFDMVSSPTEALHFYEVKSVHFSPLELLGFVSHLGRFSPLQEYKIHVIIFSSSTLIILYDSWCQTVLQKGFFYQFTTQRQCMGALLPHPLPSPEHLQSSQIFAYNSEPRVSHFNEHFFNYE